MRKDWKYIAFLSVAVVIYVAVQVLGPRDFDWTVTFHPEDRNPYGGFALSELMPGVFSKEKINRSNLTIYEIYDSLKGKGNFLSLSTSFSAGEADTKALLKNIADGGTALIAAQYFSNTFADTLSLSTNDYYFGSDLKGVLAQKDSSYIVFKNSALDDESFYYPKKNVHNFFSDFDSTRTTIIAVNDADLPVLIKVSWGKGNLYLSSTPMAFTNIYMLHVHNSGFAARAFSYLPDAEIHWTAFYHLGRMEVQTPLRFILKTPALRWAYFVLIASILLFMVFEIKRRQRVIPIIKPLANTSLEFVATVGNLYFQNADHKNIAEKKITFLLEQIRSRFLLNTNNVDDNFIDVLSKRSGHPAEEIRQLFKQIEHIHAKKSITENELITLNASIEKLMITM